MNVTGNGTTPELTDVEKPATTGASTCTKSVFVSVVVPAVLVAVNVTVYVPTKL